MTRPQVTLRSAACVAALFGAVLLGLPAAKANTTLPSKFAGGTTYFTLDWNTFTRAELNVAQQGFQRAQSYIVSHLDVGASDITPRPINEGVLSAERGNVLQFSVGRSTGDTISTYRVVPVSALTNWTESYFPREGVWSVDVYQRSSTGANSGLTSQYGGFQLTGTTDYWSTHGTMLNGVSTQAGDGSGNFFAYPRSEWFRYEVHFRPDTTSSKLANGNYSRYLNTVYINGVEQDYTALNANNVGAFIDKPRNAYFTDGANRWLPPTTGATGGPDIIRLVDLATNSRADSYILLGNMTLSTVPEPSLGLVAAGAGLLAVTGLRRVRRRR